MSTHATKASPHLCGEASAMRDDKGTYEREQSPLFDGCLLSSPLHQGIHAR